MQKAFLFAKQQKMVMSRILMRKIPAQIYRMHHTPAPSAGQDTASAAASEDHGGRADAGQGGGHAAASV
jgi:hypothetical protein